MDIREIIIILMSAFLSLAVFGIASEIFGIDCLNMLSVSALFGLVVYCFTCDYLYKEGYFVL